MIAPNKVPTPVPTKPQRIVPFPGTAAETWEPPTGIWYEHNRQRPNKPYLLRWEQSGAIRSQSFASESDRETAARKLADDRQEHGNEILTFDPREWRQWLAFKEASGGADPLVMLGEWRTMREAQGLPVNQHGTTVAKAVAEYLAFRNAGKLSRDTKTHLRAHLQDRFAATLGDEPLPKITAEMIDNWLASLRRQRNPDMGKPVDALTRRHHRKSVHVFLEWCFRVKGWIARNPCDAVQVPEVAERDVKLLTIDEGRRLFKENVGQPVIYRIAFEAFGFLRASSAGRLRKDWINFEQRGLRLFGPEHKSGKTKWRQGHPDNLWKWLEKAPDSTWAMTPLEYRNAKALAFARAKIDGGSGNRLRRTCISAHLSWQKNRPLTSELAQHSSLAMTEKYVGIMTEADGKAWFAIVP